MTAGAISRESIVRAYGRRIRRKRVLIALLALSVSVLSVYAMAHGAYPLSFGRVIRSLAGLEEGAAAIVVWDIRLPRVASAIIAGWGLAISGLAVQTRQRNSLRSMRPSR